MKRMVVQFPEIPPIGQTLLVGQRRYDLVDVMPRRPEDGTGTMRLRWRTDCPNCGAVFMIETCGPRLPQEIFDLIQCCETHNGPGGTKIVED